MWLALPKLLSGILSCKNLFVWHDFRLAPMRLYGTTAMLTRQLQRFSAAVERFPNVLNKGNVLFFFCLPQSNHSFNVLSVSLIDHFKEGWPVKFFPVLPSFMKKSVNKMSLSFSFGYVCCNPFLATFVLYQFMCGCHLLVNPLECPTTKLLTFELEMQWNLNVLLPHTPLMRFICCFQYKPKYCLQ